MPSPYDTQYHHRASAGPLARMLQDRQEAQPDLTAEIKALRNEIAQLRAELKPASTLILTGQQVAAELQRLTRRRA